MPNTILAQDATKNTESDNIIFLFALLVLTAIAKGQLSFLEVKSLDNTKFTQPEQKYLILALQQVWQEENNKPAIEDISSKYFHLLIHNNICDKNQAHELSNKFEDLEFTDKVKPYKLKPALEALSLDFNQLSSTNDDEVELAPKDVDLTTICPKSPISLLANEIAKAAQVPRNTTFLTILSIFSALSSRVASVSYRDNNTQPVSIFFCGEQPPAASKSRILNAAQASIFTLSKNDKTAFKKQIIDLKQSIDNTDIKEEKIELKNELNELIRQEKAVFTFITDATPEAIDMILQSSNGFFSLASAEQASIDSLLGISYQTDGKSNKDLILKGYNGEYHHSIRRGREGYIGHVVGSICVIAQEGTISKILEASGGTGVVERFILWSEPHLLGKRDHLNNYDIDEHAINIYDQAVETIYKQISDTNEYKDLRSLSLSVRAWRKIDNLKQHFEPTLANGAENSVNLLRGAIGKIDILIMKIASVLHLSLDQKNNLIHDDRVDEAITIGKAYVEHLKNLVDTSLAQALSDQDKEILNLIGKKTVSGKQLKDKLYRKTAFRSSDGSMMRSQVEDAVHCLLKRGLLNIDNENERSFDKVMFEKA